ncbi:hypothetical protein [Arthrobacter sp. A5]|uniref:hypothetical protein n=1 Tax=Arthrobacter sp. A5 TaxID=576926 RepID=UPI003DA9A0A8
MADGHRAETRGRRIERGEVTAWDPPRHADSVSVCGLAPFDTEVHYLDPNFIGLRTTESMYRFFGRNAFGSVVGLTVHLVGPAPTPGQPALPGGMSCLAG